MSTYLKDEPPTAILSSLPEPRSSFLYRTPPIYPRELLQTVLPVDFQPPVLPVIAAPAVLPVSHGMVCETAARLLFMNIKWAKRVPAFQTLSSEDKTILLEHSWSVLFILSASQHFASWELSDFLTTVGADLADDVVNEARIFQAILTQLRAMHLDNMEYAILRAVVLFKTSRPSDLRGLRDVAAVSTLEDQAQLSLGSYIHTTYPKEPIRFGKLLLILPTLTAVTGRTITNVFFRETIGATPIERLINDIYEST